MPASRAYRLEGGGALIWTGTSDRAGSPPSWPTRQPPLPEDQAPRHAHGWERATPWRSLLTARKIAPQRAGRLRSADRAAQALGLQNWCCCFRAPRPGCRRHTLENLGQECSLLRGRRKKAPGQGQSQGGSDNQPIVIDPSDLAQIGPVDHGLAGFRRDMQTIRSDNEQELDLARNAARDPCLSEPFPDKPIEGEAARRQRKQIACQPGCL